MKKSNITSKPTNQLTKKPSAAAITKEDARRLCDQYRNAVNAEMNSMREIYSFGAALIQIQAALGEPRGGRGGTSNGEGLKGWLERNLPEINYKTAMRYKYAAGKAVSMMVGDERQNVANLVVMGSAFNEVSQGALEGGEVTLALPNAEVVTIEAEGVERAQRFCEDAATFGKLQQMYFNFMHREDMKEKCSVNAEAVTRVKPSPIENARRIWAGIMLQLNKTASMASIAFLPPKEAEAIHGRLFELTKAMKEQMSVGK